ncbi:hypothetical protein ABEB36_000332 [Hypothenemus hampei]|uniref:Uncharacterized protein n=1 Tax=Hypothenemus hampei TaxID=57062 RepID=A0ABD1FDI3_HYPHA
MKCQKVHDSLDASNISSKRNTVYIVVIIALASKAIDMHRFSKKDIWKFSEADKNTKLCSECRKHITLFKLLLNPPSGGDMLSQVSLESLTLSQGPCKTITSVGTIGINNISN